MNKSATITSTALTKLVISKQVEIDSQLPYKGVTVIVF